MTDKDFVEAMLKSAKQKGSPKPKPLTESVDVKEVQDFIKNFKIRKKNL